MPISIADFVNETAELEVPTNHGPLKVRYRPNVMTPEKEAALTRMAAAGEDDPEAVSAVARLFCDFIEWVDLVGPLYDAAGTELVAKGKPVPLEPRVIVHLPTRLLTDVMEAATQDGSGVDPKPSTASRAGSFSRKGR